MRDVLPFYPLFIIQRHQKATSYVATFPVGGDELGLLGVRDASLVCVLSYVCGRVVQLRIRSKCARRLRHINNNVRSAKANER